MVRSEADELLLRHAGACGAQIIEETKVNAIGFKSGPTKGGTRNDDIESGANFEKPVSATWSRKDGSSGTILFDYLIDASGRQGLLSTKYLKNRTVNPNLKNIADWGYWKGGTIFAPGTKMEGTPYFEALQGTTSTGGALATKDADPSYRRKRLVLVYSITQRDRLCWYCAEPGKRS